MSILDIFKSDAQLPPGNNWGKNDIKAWQDYQSGYSTNYTASKIESLNCSQDMKNYIKYQVQINRAGAELPSEPSQWEYAFSGYWYNEATNTYSNDPPK